MSALPDGWVLACLPELCEGGLFVDGDWIESKDQDPNGRVRLVQLADIGVARFLDRSSRFLSEQRAAELRCTFLQPGDLLVSRMAEPLGRACRFPGLDQPCVTVVDVAIVRPDPRKVDPEWLMWAINAPDVRAALELEAGGTTRKRISRKNLGSVPLRVPPLAEQRRIVASIEALLARGRKARQTLDEIQPLLERLRRSILAAAFRGRLTADWRAQNPGVEPAGPRSKTLATSSQRGRYALALGAPDDPHPAGWRWLPLSSVARLESGHTPSRRRPEYWGGDIPWIGIKDASRHHGRRITSTRECVTQAGLDNSSARLLPAGTVCLSRTASVGHVVVMARPMATSQDFANWVCSDAIDPDFLRYLFWAEIESLREFGRGTTHKTIYYPQLEAFHVALPPIDEQRALVVAVESRLARVALLEQAVSSAITAARGLDDAIVASRMRRQPLAQRSS